MSTEQQELQTLDQQRQGLRDLYEQSIRDFLAIAKERAKKKQIAAFQACRAAGLAYFNAHDRAIPADARLKVDRDPTCYTDRAETSANVLETICQHYRCLRQWGGDLGIDLAVLQPSLTAFANMQRRVQETNAGLAAQLRADFVELELPTHGFDNQEAARPHQDEPTALPAQHTTNNYFHSHREGDRIMGDKISIGGDAIGSAVGSHASVKARDIITVANKSQAIDDDLRQKIEAALKELAGLKIDVGDRNDVADDVEKLTKELDNDKKDEGRIKKIWTRIQAAAPTVASILASAASLGKILGLVP